MTSSALPVAKAVVASRLNLTPQSRRLVEVVLSLRSDLLYKTVRETRFRTRFNAAGTLVTNGGVAFAQFARGKALFSAIDAMREDRVLTRGRAADLG